MKQFIATSMLVLATALSGTGNASEPDAPASDGPRVLVFWASWCGACKPLLADMAAAEQELRALGAAVQTVGIDGKPVPVQLPAVAGTQATTLRAAHEVPALPWVVVVDKHGKVIATPSAHHAPGQLTQWLKADLALAS